jgi:GTPase SAR1 family protein
MWKKNFIDNAAPADPDSFPFVLVGNKTDLEKKVTEADIKKWCEANNNMPYVETCATEGTHVEDSFRKLVSTAQESMGSSGGFDMPMSLSGAEGAVAITAKDDAARDQTNKEKKKKKCKC